MTSEDTAAGTGETVNLSLISHTNAGKTTLARTLLGRDVGEVRDAAHVTDLSTGYVLVQDGENTLMLWDTPGFGDTARLVGRLKQSGNPIGWFLTQVWDRWRERPLWSSQQAVKNAREQADVILYMVNAAEDPAATAYVALEMEVLAWIAKPVIVLLNQMGPPRADLSNEIARWAGIGVPGLVKGVLPLDAFARCWVQEGALLNAITPLLPAAKAQAMIGLNHRWAAINQERFAASMAVLAGYLKQAAEARVVVDEAGWQAKLVGALSGKPGSDRASARAMESLAKTLGAQTAASTDELIRLHGLSGKATATVLERVGDDYAHQTKTPEGAAAVLGGLASGAVGGLAADLAAGGLTLGGGLIVGAIVGALGAKGVARGFNMARGEDGSGVQWSGEFLERLTVTALMRYLAVAHFGRGRGEWAEGEHPAFWQPLAAEAVSRRREELLRLLRPRGNAVGDGRIEDVLEQIAAQILRQLYPGASIPIAADAVPEPK